MILQQIECVRKVVCMRVNKQSGRHAAYTWQTCCSSLDLLIPRHIARHCIADKPCRKVVRDLLDMVASELFSISLSQVSATIDNGSHDENVHHFAARSHTIVFHCLKHTATVHEQYACLLYGSQRWLSVICHVQKHTPQNL